MSGSVSTGTQFMTEGDHGIAEAVPHILVVDDEPDILRFISRCFRGQGFAVDCASGVAMGLELTRSREYDLIVLDLMMPDIDGVAALKALVGANPDQRILVLSALTDVTTKVRCLELGATDYLSKPFALAELVARVRARLRTGSEAAPTRFLRSAGVTLDLERHTADVGQGPIALSGREFELLHHLMRRGGAVCSREQLLASVWHMEFDPGTNVVDVCIRRLRTKLGGEVIETLRNVGYALRSTA